MGCIALLWMASLFRAEAQVAIEILPPTPLIERTQLGEVVNCDFLMTNNSGKQLELSTVRLAVRDGSGKIVRRVQVNDNGIAPGIETITGRKFAPGEAHTVFNPLHTFPEQIPLDLMDFEFVFTDAEGNLSNVMIQVRPQTFTTKTRLFLPLKGRLLVWDGHDYYAHHRRIDYVHPIIKAFNWRTNSSRYSLDLVVTDPDGNMHGASEDKSGYFGYSQPVYAPAGGVVVKAVGTVAEGAQNSLEALGADLTTALGNQVVIDHGNGEFSHLGHLKPGSVLVKVGDRVEAGQKLGAVGTSGWSLFPHLHYELTRSADMKLEGLPAIFHDFRRVLGTKSLMVAGGTLDSGDIIDSGRQTN